MFMPEEMKMRQLLREAKCPNSCNQGVVRLPFRGEHGQMAEFCKWCWSRKEILRET